MNYDDLVSAIKSIAESTNASAGYATWYLFGSALKELSNPSDIDLAVVCPTHVIADAVRQLVDIDQLDHPIHLSIFTVQEEAELRFTAKQGCVQVA